MYSLFGPQSGGKTHVLLKVSTWSLLSQKDDKRYYMSTHSSQNSLHQATWDFDKSGNFNIVDLYVGVAVISPPLFSLRQDFSLIVSLMGKQ